MKEVADYLRSDMIERFCCRGNGKLHMRALARVCPLKPPGFQEAPHGPQLDSHRSNEFKQTNKVFLISTLSVLLILPVCIMMTP